MNRERDQARYLRTETDHSFVATWHLLSEGDDFQEGYVDVWERGEWNRYRLYVPRIINCGFPYYYLEDGETGRFYLKWNERDPEDELDGFIDSFNFVHFKPKRKN